MPSFNLGGGQRGWMAPEATNEEKAMLRISRTQLKLAWATLMLAGASLVTSIVAIVVAFSLA